MKMAAVARQRVAGSPPARVTLTFATTVSPAPYEERSKFSSLLRGLGW